MRPFQPFEQEAPDKRSSKFEIAYNWNVARIYFGNQREARGNTSTLPATYLIRKFLPVLYFDSDLRDDIPPACRLCTCRSISPLLIMIRPIIDSHTSIFTYRLTNSLSQPRQLFPFFSNRHELQLYSPPRAVIG